MEKKRVVKRFTHEDDQLIRSCIQQYGIFKGIVQASKKLNRTERSIKDRYTLFIASKKTLNFQEVQKLIQLHESGESFKKLKNIFNMNPVNLRIEYHKAKRIMENIDPKIMKSYNLPNNNFLLMNSDLSNFGSLTQTEQIIENENLFDFNDFDFKIMIDEGNSA